MRRVGPEPDWRAVAGEKIVARAKCFIRPDGRCFLSVESRGQDAFAALVSAVADEMSRALHVHVGDADGEALRRYRDLGFTDHRRENVYLVPTDPLLTGLRALTPPSGFALVAADRVDETRLRLLDDALRQDVPGTDGWQWDADGFHEETHSEAFDPATYLVALYEDTGEYGGLVRVWNNPERPRLGLIGVLPPYRRRGLARALLAHAFAVLHERGVEDVETEVDETNTASLALIESLGARRIGAVIELKRPGSG